MTKMKEVTENWMRYMISRSFPPLTPHHTQVVIPPSPPPRLTRPLLFAPRSHHHASALTHPLLFALSHHHLLASDRAAPTTYHTQAFTVLMMSRFYGDYLKVKKDEAARAAESGGFFGFFGRPRLDLRAFIAQVTTHPSPPLPSSLRPHPPLPSLSVPAPSFLSRHVAPSTSPLA